MPYYLRINKVYQPKDAYGRRVAVTAIGRNEDGRAGVAGGFELPLGILNLLIGKEMTDDGPAVGEVFQAYLARVPEGTI